MYLVMISGVRTIRPARVLGRECGEIVYFAVDYDPAVVWSGVLVDLGDRNLGVGHVWML